ncbi:MAG: tetratricopeptide repeat protein [Opitutaceae bacterium]|nr:tetratricopeptide repeat protein [Opitutaceae bacterium]
MLAAFVLGAATLAAHPEIEEALTRLNAAIAAQPANAELYLQRGELYSRHEDWVSAEANFLLAAELSPRLPRLAQARGALELSAGRPQDAVALLDTALALDPTDAAALVLRARAHRALKAHAAALADLDTAIAQLAQPPPELFIERAALLPPAEAIRGLDEGIARLGPVVTLHLRAVALEESLGRVDAAAARFLHLAATSERPEGWHKRRGDLLARAGRKADARTAYAAALAAIAALPPWLRTSPDTARLTAELTDQAAARP